MADYYTRNTAGDLVYDPETGSYIPAEPLVNIISIQQGAFLNNTGYVNPNIVSVDFSGRKFSPIGDMSGAFVSTGNSKLQSVTNLCSNTTRMESTFYNCRNLQTITDFPANVTDMTGTFYKCINLVNIPAALPNNIISMDYTFGGCNKLTSVPDMPDTVTSAVGTYQVTDRLVNPPKLSNSLTKLPETFWMSGIVDIPKIPNSVTSLTKTFMFCTRLVDLANTTNRLHNGITDMYMSFCKTFYMTTAPILPSSVTNMFDTFYMCENLTSTPVIPDSVTSMAGTFQACYNLTNITNLPPNVVNLGAGGTDMMPEIPGLVHGIGSGCFAYCESLTKEGIPTIPNSVRDMCGTFAYCDGLVSTPNLPNAVVNIAECFMGCENLQNVSTEIPTSVTNVRNTFANCTNLTGDVVIKSNKIQDATHCFINTTATKNVYIPFTYSNSVHTKTYNSFINAGYDTAGTTCGVYLKDIDNKVLITINPTPADATVTFNVPGYTQSGNSIEVPTGMNVEYSVSKQYHVTVSDTILATTDTTIPVTLDWDCYVPEINENIVNLSGSSKYEGDTKFVPGRYEIDLAAGGEYAVWSNGYDASKEGGRVTQIINVTEPFVVRAYSGSRGTSDGNNGTIGTNPYSGPFKVNGLTANGTPSYVNHIFGNAGTVSMSSSGPSSPSSGNCLGNGAFAVGTSSGAGSCLHLMPIDGVFGTDYLFAFHATGATCAVFGGASGSAYGGAGSGTSLSFFGESTMSSSAGGSTPYGNGGAGVNNSAGNDGTGVGCGKGSGVGAAAWYDGTNWQTSTASNTKGIDGYIRITYLGQ